MLNTETAIIRGAEYSIIRSGQRALVSSKSQVGGWHTVSASCCDCPGFANRSRCAHLDALASLDLQQQIEAAEAEAAAVEARIRDLREGIAALAASPAKALPAASEPAVSKLHRLSAEAQAAIL